MRVDQRRRRGRPCSRSRRRCPSMPASSGRPGSSRAASRSGSAAPVGFSVSGGDRDRRGVARVREVARPRRSRAPRSCRCPARRSCPSRTWSRRRVSSTVAVAVDPVAGHADVVARGVPGQVDLARAVGGRVQVARRRRLLVSGGCTVTVALLLGSERLPAASMRAHLVAVGRRASTLVSEYEVAAPIAVDQRRRRGRSRSRSRRRCRVAASQLRSTWLELLRSRSRLPGAVGFSVSGTVTVAVLLGSERLPAASTARTV